MSETIKIRHAEPEDYEALHRIFSGPKAIAGTLQLPFPSREGWRKRLAEIPDGLYSLVASVEGEIVGSLGLRTFPLAPRRSHVGQIGMAVRDDWQRRGVGTALLGAAIDMAQNWLNLSRLELTVFVENAPAIRLYEKFGFETEGRLANYALRDGLLVDCFEMALIRKSEWGS